MDPESTEPDGAHALVTLLRDNGVDVVVADGIADVEKRGAPRHADTGGGEPVPDRSRAAGPVGESPRRSFAGGTDGTNPRGADARTCACKTTSTFDSDPNCTLREANRAGSVRFGPSDTYEAKGRVVTSCYDGALIRYRDGGRTVTVVGSTDFMTNGGLLHAGNAALAMNLAGDRPRLIWYAPHRIEGETSSPTSIFDLIPDNVHVDRLAAVAGRAAGRAVEGPPDRPVGGRGVARRGPRIGDRRGPWPALSVPPGARSRRRRAAHRDTAAAAAPARAWAPGAPAPAVVTTVAQRSGADASFVGYHLFGPPPATDNDLLQLARALDEIERQVTHS